MVKNNQIEFVNGAWVDNDEATPNFDDIINNMMIGHEFIKKTFGVYPKIGWDIDTFGHSDANTRLYGQMGYDAIFFSRLDEPEKQERSKKRSMNFLWRPSSTNFGNEYQVLTSVFKEDYCAPSGFGVGDNMISGDYFEDDKDLSSSNAKELMNKLIEFIHKVHDRRLGNEVLLPWGCDFTYMSAQAEFANLERVVNYVNKNNAYNITLKISTPSDYIQALKKENIHWPVKYEDSMPYSSADWEYWTGYFVSRPNAKKLTKDASALLQAENLMFSKRVLQDDVRDDEVNEILAARKDMLQALSTYLHHDAISGTAR